MSTGNHNIDQFFEEYDRRISDADTRHTAESKEVLRRARPGLLLWAQNDPAAFEEHMLKVIGDHLRTLHARAARADKI
jgi:hypothetical protein